MAQTSPASETDLHTIPRGPLGFIPLKGVNGLGERIDWHLVNFRKVHENAADDDIIYSSYYKPSYIVPAECPRFGSGEGKGVIKESVRGMDLFIMVDVTNHSQTYKLCGEPTRMSPDDHFQDLKRVIAAASGSAKRINVIMPFLYEGRQHRRAGRESLDCALAMHELVNMGVDTIITFEAHDPRVANAVPLASFENVRPSYQFVKFILRACPDIIVDSDHLMTISPDEGGMSRAIYMANNLGVNMGMFYKRRDYTKIVDGKNPIVAHEYLGPDLGGKDIWIVDDMISSGDSMIDVAKGLKERGAGRIFVLATFGLFTNGIERFDKVVEEGLIYKVATTNLCYQDPELLSRPWYINCDMSKYIAYIINTLNHDKSISELLDPVARIQKLLKRHKAGEKI